MNPHAPMTNTGCPSAVPSQPRDNLVALIGSPMGRIGADIERPPRSSVAGIPSITRHRCPISRMEDRRRLSDILSEALALTADPFKSNVKFHERKSDHEGKPAPQ